MAHHIEYSDTTNRRRGSSGGGTAETFPADTRRHVPLPPRGEDASGDPFSISTTRFQDAERQVVTERRVGSGD